MAAAAEMAMMDSDSDESEEEGGAGRVSSQRQAPQRKGSPSGSVVMTPRGTAVGIDVDGTRYNNVD